MLKKHGTKKLAWRMTDTVNVWCLISKDVSRRQQANWFNDQFHQHLFPTSTHLKITVSVIIFLSKPSKCSLLTIRDASSLSDLKFDHTVPQPLLLLSQLKEATVIRRNDVMLSLSQESIALWWRICDNIPRSKEWKGVYFGRWLTNNGGQACAFCKYVDTYFWKLCFIRHALCWYR